MSRLLCSGTAQSYLLGLSVRLPLPPHLSRDTVQRVVHKVAIHAV